MYRKDEKLLAGSKRTVAIALSQEMKPLSSLTVLYTRYNGWFVKGVETFALASVHIEDSAGNSV